MTKHTPGDWKIVDDAAHPSNKRITSDGRRHIAKVYATRLHTDDGEANAKLIAAAPALLAACKVALLSFSPNHAPDNYYQIHRAILAAEGSDAKTD